MRRVFTRQVLFVSAGVLMLAAVLLTWNTLRRLDAASRTLRGKAQELGDLQAVRARLARREAAISAFARAGNVPPVSVRTLIRQIWPDQPAPDLRESTEASVPGWRLRRAEIAFGDAELERVAAFVEAAESRRPPWRVMSYEIKASPHTPGAGHVVLKLATAERE